MMDTNLFLLFSSSLLSFEIPLSPSQRRHTLIFKKFALVSLLVLSQLNGSPDDNIELRVNVQLPRGSSSS